MQNVEGVRVKSSDPLSYSLTRKEKIMEVYRWVKAMLLGTAVIIFVRLIATEFEFTTVAQWSGYLAVVMVLIGGVLAIVGAVADRRSSALSEEEHE